MSVDKKLKVTEIQRFCMHDGPGIRTTVFLKGCPLRCKWCHNPETQRACDELLFYPEKCIGCKLCGEVCRAGAHAFLEERLIDRTNCKTCFECAKNCPSGALERCGTDMTVGEILSVIDKDSAFYGDTGGVTVSGGEPFAQTDATVALLKACKERGLSTAVETCGYADTEILMRAAPFTDLFLWDIKDTDEERHIRYTGVSNRLILKNLSAVNGLSAKIRLRCILVNGINTDETHYKKVSDIAKSIRNFDGIELIPYHAYGGSKSVFVGKADNGKKEWIPDIYQIDNAKAYFESCGIKMFN